ncbi:CAP domain-containing protein [Pseudonocardia sichuanensis]
MTVFGRLGSALLGAAATAVLFSGIAAAAPVAASAAPSRGGAVADLVAATNAARQAAGCPAVEPDAQLHEVAQAHAAELARHRYLEHVDREGRTSDERIRSAGYGESSGENLAFGYPTAAEVMEVWMSSSGHRRSIEDCTYTAIGVGYVADGHYWVQDFGS